MELRVVERDQNLDIMNEFLNQGEFQSVPVAVFYTGDHHYIYHFTERPQKANDEMGEMRKLREGNGFKLEEVAVQLGVAPSTLSSRSRPRAFRSIPAMANSTLR